MCLERMEPTHSPVLLFQHWPEDCGVAKCHLINAEIKVRTMVDTKFPLSMVSNAKLNCLKTHPH